MRRYSAGPQSRKRPAICGIRCSILRIGFAVILVSYLCFVYVNIRYSRPSLVNRSASQQQQQQQVEDDKASYQERIAALPIMKRPPFREDMFADDTTIYRFGHNDDQASNVDSSQIENKANDGHDDKESNVGKEDSMMLNKRNNWEDEMQDGEEEDSTELTDLDIDPKPQEASLEKDSTELIKDITTQESYLELTDRIFNPQNQKKAKVRMLLNSFRTDQVQRELEIKNQPDYNEETLNRELEKLRNEMQSIGNEQVKRSIELFVRPGHRRRLTDLIGGVPLQVTESRKMIKTSTSLFDKSPPHDLRDYVKEPIQVNIQVNRDMPCDIPCDSCWRSGKDCDSTLERFTMENVPANTNGKPYELSGNTLFTSMIPLPYFSWHDFGILRPITEQRTGGLAAAFISNCAFQKRNRMVRDLIDIFGKDRVHSYGRCEHNKNEDTGASPEAKINNLQSYKFSLAFENSEMNDYITEKFFGTLVSGSVPVYIGAPNVKFFAPDTGPFPYESDSVIRVGDYGDNSTILARVLKALDEDDEAFNQLLEWKNKGYSDDYKTLIDFANVHSSCRSCIRLADQRRVEFGVNKYDAEHLVQDNTAGNDVEHHLYIRERGRYSFIEFGFDGKPTSIIELVTKVLERMDPMPVNLWKDNEDRRPLKHLKRVYGFYTISNRRPVLSDEDVQSLPNLAELEVIFT